MKKILPISLFSFLLLSSWFFLSSHSDTIFGVEYSGGVAAVSGADWSGSPLSSGSCITCHSGGGTTSVVFELRDASNNVVTSYIPGASYTVKHQVTTSLSSTGLQSTALLAGNTQAGTVSAVLTANSQISTSTAGNQIMEHQGANATGLFEFTWVAPVTGSGNVTFYSAANGVNLAGGTSGDQGSAPISNVISEAVCSTPPTAVCQNISVFVDGSGNATITPSDLDGGSTIVCGPGSFSASQTAFTCADVGANNVVFTVTDANSASDDCMAVVTVSDTISPIAVCQNITAFLDGTGNVTITAADLDAGSSDNCGPVSLGASTTAFTCANIGANGVTLFVQDANGNISSCNAVVTISDTISPTITCPGNQSESLDASCNFTLPDYTNLVSATDGCATPSTGSAVWINEIHYDNSGSDVNEGVEIAGVAGTDLSAYTIVLYNGNGGASYNTVALSGIIPDEGVGAGAVMFLISGVQNGAPDGVALIENPGTVLEFINYEGTTMTASNGPASGMTSTNIGVTETSSTPIGQSLQLTGSGSSPADYTWQSPAASSYGTLNSGQTYTAPSGGVAITQSPAAGTVISGTTAITMTATDGSGNTSTCSFDVTVSDAIPPTAICQPFTVNLDAAGNGSLVAADIDGGSSDNCGSITLSASQTAFTCANVGLNNVILTVDDGNGNSSTCTAIVTVVGSSTAGTDVISSCAPITWIDGMMYTASNNSAMFTIVGGAANGCDSIVTLDFTLNSGSTGTDVISDCNPITWIDGMMYSASNNSAMFTIVGGAANGCDSIVTLDFTLLPGSTGTDVIADCNPITWIDGIMYTASNNSAMFTIVGGAANGCDSIVTLDFTLLPGSTGTDVISDCNPITWIDGMTYSASNNTAMHTLVGGAANGCDSIVTLDFTLNSGSTGTDVISDCNPITWIDGMMYSASNNTAMFTIVGGAANGCDSIVTLDFTLNSGSTGTDVISDCNPITWIDGMMYSASNNTAMFTIVGGAANGCDSIVTLDFTLNSGSTGTDVISDCNPITWIDGMMYSASNNSAMFTIVGGAANGCDSIVTLDFTLLPGSTGTDVISDCNPITWIDGMMYSASNNSAMFTIVGGAANGCDSIVTLDFTLLPAATGTDVQSACGTFFWIDGNTYTASTNTPTFTIVGGAASGCDSIVTLDLTMTTPAQVAFVNSTNITTTSAEITWNPVPLPATGYYSIQYRVVGTTPWIQGTFASSVSTSVVQSGLTLGTAYEIRVTAFCATLSQGPPSVSHFFSTTSGACNDPIVLTSSVNSGNSVTLNWAIVSGAGWYEFRYKESSSAIWLNGGTITASSTSKTIFGLNPSTSYDFEGRTFCPSGAAGTWSSTLTVTTNALAGCNLPPAVVASTVTGSGATITWTAVPGAGWYTFRYKESSSSVWIPGGSAGGAATSKSYTGLTPGVSYDFEGKTNCTNGTSSAWGATTFTTTVLGGCELPPVLDPVVLASTTTSITIGWAAVTGAAWYTFQYKESSSVTWINGGSASGSATSKTYAGLSPFTSYDFQVKTYCPNGAGSDWSSTGTYSTGTPPTFAMNIDSSNDKVTVLDDKALAAANQVTNVYPNPATEKVNVDIYMDAASDNSAMRLLDMSGRLVREVSMQNIEGLNTLTMDLQGLSDGLYTMHVYQNGSLMHTAKVKKK